MKTIAFLALLLAACATTTPAPTSADHWVQVGTYRLESEANQVRDSLRTLGYEADVERANTVAEPLGGGAASTRLEYRVRIGPVGYEEATTIRTKLTSAGVQAVVTATP
ncbi:MAG TPA: SPOR domain-containing protein [Thermoanaerobaculia bacterium]|jgi:cell division protein FtsN